MRAPNWLQQEKICMIQQMGSAEPFCLQQKFVVEAVLKDPAKYGLRQTSFVPFSLYWGGKKL